MEFFLSEFDVSHIRAAAVAIQVCSSHDIGTELGSCGIIIS
jgi:hypothetical protein